jgi:hypothetical protein
MWPFLFFALWLGAFGFGYLGRLVTVMVMFYDTRSSLDIIALRQQRTPECLDSVKWHK